MIGEGDWGTKEKAKRIQYPKNNCSRTAGPQNGTICIEAVARTGHVQTTETEFDLA